ncbi:hypothetical protein JIN86_18115 [Lysinibacillus sp. HST-98]|uniref:hypothetical protein n=1 Tax=Lysinibacillus TaxID=400634 RepID=UPI0001DA56C9|nr:MULTISPECIES: hypothetical protein [Lysinibacillus]EFI68897.1 hypothetical protein BFZC1_10025 [Lysinibacillus fusiformis ZC1]EKU41941.1 hypothetical protein C518_2894 [Lysinibacillus fusiformis ZB2]MBL3731507.1 hypothetical protein [Lysinibacillus sp. HST-98]MBU5254262.1 hypothetical protein [Lysinibacillus capsici]MED4699467.1 hypothetical protein [Lysinibacillus capsici]
MLNAFSPRAKYFIAALMLAILTPFLGFFMPLTISHTFYFNKDNVVLITPPSNFIMLLIAFGLIVLALIVLGLKRNPYIYVISSAITLSSFVLGYYSFSSYSAIQKDQIVFQQYYHQTIYKWQDIHEVIYEYEIGTVGTYYFQTTNNEKFVIMENGQFGLDEKRAIYQLAMLNGAKFTEREKSI